MSSGTCAVHTKGLCQELCVKQGQALAAFINIKSIVLVTPEGFFTVAKEKKTQKHKDFFVSTGSIGLKVPDYVTPQGGAYFLLCVSSPTHSLPPLCSVTTDGLCMNTCQTQRDMQPTNPVVCCPSQHVTMVL